MSFQESGKMADVLLVEDDVEDIEITRRAFKTGGIRNPLYVVRDGEEAMEFLQRRGRYADPAAAPRPGLILLDLNLPGLDGREVLRLIKNGSSLRRIPVVVLTTSSEEIDVLSSYEFGANSYITKPAEFDRFLEAIVTIGRYWLSIARIPDGGEEMEELSMADELISVADRRYLMQKVEQEVMRSACTGRPFALLMIALDYPEHANDRSGRRAGDEVLGQCASALKRNLRSTDLIGRYGGEEFCVLLPETPVAGARAAAEKLRKAAKALPAPVPIVSIGVALWELRSSTEDILKRADQALCKAKEAGGDRVVVYGEWQARPERNVSQ